MKLMCAMCKQTKDESEFRYLKNRKRFYSYCNDCNRIYNREYSRYRREKEKNI